MNELNVKTINGIEVIDSRDVATMVSRSHKELLRTIHQYIEYMEDGAERNSAPGISANICASDFFIDSTYADRNGQTRPNYLITKMGCEMIANKMTGRKGVQFTAAYVSAFNKMLNERKQIAAPAQPTMAIVKEMELRFKVMEKMGCSPYEIAGMMTSMDKAYGIAVSKVLADQLDPQLCLFDAPALPADAPLLLS